jgi:hypothetical protein
VALCHPAAAQQILAAPAAKEIREVLQSGDHTAVSIPGWWLGHPYRSIDHIVCTDIYLSIHPSSSIYPSTHLSTSNLQTYESIRIIKFKEGKLKPYFQNETTSQVRKFQLQLLKFKLQLFTGPAGMPFRNPSECMQVLT